MTPDSLRELADRVEGASGPDRALDCLIYELDCLRGTGVKLRLTAEMRGMYYGEPTGRYFDVSGESPVEIPYQAPKCTASLDAAMSLVMAGADWLLENEDGYFRAEANDDVGRASTPALALTAAALRAQASLLEATPTGAQS